MKKSKFQFAAIICMLLLSGCSSGNIQRWGDINENTSISKAELLKLIDTSVKVSKEDSLILKKFPACGKNYIGILKTNSQFHNDSLEVCKGSIFSEKPYNSTFPPKNIVIENTYQCGDSLFSKFGNKYSLDFRGIKISDTIYITRHCLAHTKPHTDSLNLIFISSSNKTTIPQSLKLNNFDEFANKLKIKSIRINGEDKKSLIITSNFTKNIIEAYQRKTFKSITIYHDSQTNPFIKIGLSALFFTFHYAGLEFYNLASQDKYQTQKVFFVGATVGILYGMFSAFSDDQEVLQVINIQEINK